MGVFQGEDKAWWDSSFQFRAALRGAVEGVLDVSSVELAPNDVKTEDLETQCVEETDVEQWGAEPYDVLCSLTVGEALIGVRGETGMNGFTA